MIENQEGTAVEDSQVEGAEIEKSPVSATNNGKQKSPAGGANTGASDVPFHKNPEFQGYLERQKKSWDREWNSRLTEMQTTYDKKFTDLQNSFSNRSGQPLSAEDASQLRQLVKLIKSDPEAAKELGLDSIKTLQDEIDNLRSSSSEQTIEREAASVVEEYADKYGYDQKQLDRELWEFIRDDDYWGDQPFSKGIFRKAARDFFSDKSQELAERAANMKLVTENKNKNKAGSQKPVGTGQAPVQEAPKSMREAIRQSMKKHSGEVAFGE